MFGKKLRGTEHAVRFTEAKLGPKISGFGFSLTDAHPPVPCCAPVHCSGAGVGTVTAAAGQKLSCNPASPFPGKEKLTQCFVNHQSTLFSDLFIFS